MASFLLELFSEEIPARMQEQAALHLKAVAEVFLKEAKISPDAIRYFVTPRRLAILCDKMPDVQPDVRVEKKGPKASAPQAAIDGFLKSAGLPLDQLEKRMVGKDETYFAVTQQKGKPVAEVLTSVVEDILTSFPWPKSMRWGSGETRWVRPLHSILCLFDGKVVPVKFAGLKAGNVTYGHRFLAPDAITVTKPEDYAALLKKAYVLADAGERKAEILKQAEAAAAKHGLTLKRDDGLLQEVTGLVEWPNVLVGRIDAKFMDLPPEVLISEMRAHQKYFALLRPSSRGAAQAASTGSHAAGDPALPLRGPQDDGAFSDRFLITANMLTEDEGKAVIAGNERVLRARLSDGRFFWDQDRKKPLSEWAKGLEGVTFHAKIGTIAQKVERVAKLAVALADSVPGADQKLVERAAQLCKADLTTGMVGEFPELQGIMGRYYALAQKEDAGVADAIRDHYLPLGPDSPVPTKPVSICVALADKLDTLISMFAAGEKPTGSKDPFALRRGALGVIRIILENKIRFKLTKTIHDHLNEILRAQTLTQLANVAQGAENIKNSLAKGTTAPELDNAIAVESVVDKSAITRSILEFFSDRLKVQLKDQGIRHDLISAVMANGDDDLVRVVSRAKALQAFLAHEDGANLLAAYRRAGNIVAIEAKKDKTSFKGEINLDLLEQAEEKNLHKRLDDSKFFITQHLQQEKFEQVMVNVAALRPAIDAFFDKVLVNAEDKALRTNRLNLLACIRLTLDGIADFERIDG